MAEMYVAPMRGKVGFCTDDEGIVLTKGIPEVPVGVLKAAVQTKTEMVTDRYGNAYATREVQEEMPEWVQKMEQLEQRIEYLEAMIDVLMEGRIV